MPYIDYHYQLLVGEFPCRAFEQANGQDLPVRICELHIMKVNVSRGEFSVILGKWCLLNTKEPVEKYLSLLFRAMTVLRIWWNTFTHRVSQEVTFIFLHEFFFGESTVNYRSVMGFHTHWVRGKPWGGRRRDGKIKIPVIILRSDTIWLQNGIRQLQGRTEHGKIDVNIS